MAPRPGVPCQDTLHREARLGARRVLLRDPLTHITGPLVGGLKGGGGREEGGEREAGKEGLLTATGPAPQRPGLQQPHCTLWLPIACPGSASFIHPHLPLNPPVLPAAHGPHEKPLGCPHSQLQDSSPSFWSLTQDFLAACSPPTPEAPGPAFPPLSARGATPARPALHCPHVLSPSRPPSLAVWEGAFIIYVFYFPCV